MKVWRVTISDADGHRHQYEPTIARAEDVVRDYVAACYEGEVKAWEERAAEARAEGWRGPALEPLAGLGDRPTKKRIRDRTTIEPLEFVATRVGICKQLNLAAMLG